MLPTKKALGFMMIEVLIMKQMYINKWFVVYTFLLVFQALFKKKAYRHVTIGF